jgi:hypothetical protein
MRWREKGRERRWLQRGGEAGREEEATDEVERVGEVHSPESSPRCQTILPGNHTDWKATTDPGWLQDEALRELEP